MCYAGFPGTSPAISTQFTLKICVTARNRKKPYFKNSRSFKVIDVGNNKKLVNTACHDKQHVCLCLSATVFKLQEITAVK